MVVYSRERGRDGSKADFHDFVLSTLHFETPCTRALYLEINAIYFYAHKTAEIPTVSHVTHLIDAGGFCVTVFITHAKTGKYVDICWASPSLS